MLLMAIRFCPTRASGRSENTRFVRFRSIGPHAFSWYSHQHAVAGADPNDQVLEKIFMIARLDMPHCLPSLAKYDISHPHSSTLMIESQCRLICFYSWCWEFDMFFAITWWMCQCHPRFVWVWPCISISCDMLSAMVSINAKRKVLSHGMRASQAFLQHCLANTHRLNLKKTKLHPITPSWYNQPYVQDAKCSRNVAHCMHLLIWLVLQKAAFGSFWRADGICVLTLGSCKVNVADSQWNLLEWDPLSA